MNSKYDCSVLNNSLAVMALCCSAFSSGVAACLRTVARPSAAVFTGATLAVLLLVSELAGLLVTIFRGDWFPVLTEFGGNDQINMPCKIYIQF